jgi:hypothetical protein
MVLPPNTTGQEEHTAREKDEDRKVAQAMEGQGVLVWKVQELLYSLCGLAQVSPLVSFITQALRPCLISVRNGAENTDLSTDTLSL